MILWSLESAALALSIFVTVMLLWLGLTVWLNGERGQSVVHLSAAGLLAAALFFLSHTMILGLGFTQTGLGMDFWWRLAWIPLPVVPFAWLLTVIRYAGLSPEQHTIYRRWQIALGLGCLVLVAVFLFANPFPSYASLVNARILNTTRAWWFAGLPVMLWLYLPYAVLCYLVPLIALRSPSANQEPHIGARPWLAAVRRRVRRRHDRRPRGPARAGSGQHHGRPDARCVSIRPARPGGGEAALLQRLEQGT